MQPADNQAVIAAVRDTIRERRTIKPALMSSRVIERAVIDDILEAAQWAPTHGRTEPWRFRVYAGEARRDLAGRLVALYRAGVPADKQKPEKIEQLEENPLRASHVIAVWMKRGTNEKIPEIEEIEAVACAVQNLQLMARAHGVASFWGTGIQAYHEAAGDLFNIAPPDRFLGVVYLGYPAKVFPRGHRTGLDPKVEWAPETSPCKPPVPHADTSESGFT